MLIYCIREKQITVLDYCDIYLSHNFGERSVIFNQLTKL